MDGWMRIVEWMDGGPLCRRRRREVLEAEISLIM